MCLLDCYFSFLFTFNSLAQLVAVYFSNSSMKLIALRLLKNHNIYHNIYKLAPQFYWKTNPKMKEIYEKKNIRVHYF